MQLELFRSLWTNGFDLDAALRDVRMDLFDGIEGPLPNSTLERREFVAKLRGAACPFIAEIVTGGGYVPVRREPEFHFEEFVRKAEAAKNAGAIFLTILAGCDAWPLEVSLDFFGRCLQVGREMEIDLNFETHRSRPTFNPWETKTLLEQLPDLRITCDFSHWCCVCERLVLDGETEILKLCARRTGHIHARIGYEQGPQVPHPAAPEYSGALAAHQRWWEVIWETQRDAGRTHLTMTPEFGPDGYLQSAPFTKAPVANLDEINRWMADRQRAHFAKWAKESLCVSPK